MREQLKLHRGYIIVSLILAVVLTLPGVGFYYGFVSSAEGVGKTFGNGLGGFSWRIISGLFCAILVTFEGGYMPHNEGGTAYTNLRHLIIPTFFALSALIYVVILSLLGLERLIHGKDQ